MKKTLLTILLFTQLFSCGKIKEFEFTIEDQNEASFYHLITKIDKTSYRLPVFSLPLYDFSQGLIVGEITVTGDNTIDLLLNTDVIDDIGMGIEWKLPNGKPIPYILKPGTKTYHFQIGNSQSRVYLAFENDQAIIGLSLNISQLPPTQVPGGLNAFIPFNKNEISGTMGLYMGQQVGTSGFALFVDFGSFVNSQNSSLESYVESPRRKSFRHSAKMAKEYLLRDDLQLY